MSRIKDLGLKIQISETHLNKIGENIKSRANFNNMILEDLTLNNENNISNNNFLSNSI
jgi:hypothetical protein